MLAGIYPTAFLASSNRLPRRRMAAAMAHVCASQPEDYVLGNVRGVVGDPLKVARDQQRI